MVDLNEINREISRLENAGTTYANCEKLAMLYTVRQNQGKVENRSVEAYSLAAAPESDFIAAAREIETEDLLQIINEHMDAVRILYPKEYNLVLKKIRAKA